MTARRGVLLVPSVVLRKCLRQGLHMCILAKKKDFKHVLGELAEHVGSLSFFGVVKIAAAMATSETPVFEEPRDPYLDDWEEEFVLSLDWYFSDEFDEKIVTFECEFTIWRGRVCKWKENCVLIHSFILDNTDPELQAYL